MTARERKKRRRRLRRRRVQAITLLVLTISLVSIVALRAGQEPEAPAAPIASTTTLAHTLEGVELPAVSEKPSVTAPPEPSPEPESRYAALEVSEDDIYTLACLVYHEARGESFEGQVAVIEVVLNRMLSPHFPDTDKEQYLAVHTAIEEREHILSEDTVYFSTAPYNESVDMIIGNHYFCKIF